MLTVSGVGKSYGGRTLFVDAALQINRGDRIGLVGPNGAGKTTLFRLILGEEQPDVGSIALPRGISVGFLPQENAPVAEETVLELAVSISPEWTRLWRELGAHPQTTGGTPAGQGEDWARFDELGGHQVVARAKQILHGLGFRETDLDRPARTLSGGWVMRAHLARLLVEEPDLLLLDEPTNHLDLEALLWFQEYLRAFPGGLLVISHDREFLNELVDSIVEIRQSQLVRYWGNYDQYVEQREAQEDQQRAAWKNQQREIARLQRFVDRFRAKNTKASQAQSKLKQIERMVKIEAPAGEEATIDFEFPQPERSGQRVITLRGIHQAYGETVVYQGMDFEVERGQRIVLVGPNGAGKSTLLKLLAGVITPQAGSRALGHQARVGYYSQYRIEQLHPDWTVLEEAMATPRAVTELFVRTVVGSFLFRGDDVFKPVRVLSGGEKSRLALVKLLLDPPNLLLLDEPTTHLDIPSTEVLLAALAPFDGTIVFISHDVFFLRSLANHVVHVRDGRLTAYPGGYDYYAEKTASAATIAASVAESRRAATAETSRAREKRERKRQEAERRQIRSRTLREQRGLVDRLEEAIHALERRQAELTGVMEDPTTYADSRRAVDVSREFQANREQLERLNAEWETAATRLAEMGE
jgi:ATP-binding cassette subfamily F protein 3